jgi:hypothetical protein
LLASVSLILVLFLLIRIQGQVRGSEFSPTHFQQRRFQFYEIPLLHLQITPIRRRATTPATARYLRQKSLIPRPTGPPEPWHLVSLSRGLSNATPADAKLLADQLDLRSGPDHYWRKWSIDHPQHARVLWPVIQKLAIRELYILMPSLLELAQRKQSPGQLQTAIDQRLKRNYRSLVRDMQAADRGQLARQLLAEARQDFPDDPELARLRVGAD